MKTVDLYELTRVKDPDLFNIFFRRLSENERLIKAYEQESLNIFVETLIDNGLDKRELKNFYLSYEINQISKEFDLLRIGVNNVVNIELKSQPVEIDKIKSQLRRNYNYLRHLSKEVILIAFISSNRVFYRYYDNGTFDIITTNEVISILNKQFEFECFCGDICSLFKTSNYLVSPLNTPHKFLDKQYFLTNQQESIRLDIISKIEKTNESQVGLFFGLTGGPGTGKTLALYDLAFNTKSDDLVCIIHCGKLSLGHDYLKGTTPNINILPAKGIHYKDLSKYKYIFVDECHRIYIHQFEYIIDTARKNHLVCILSYDENQVLSRTEKKNEIVDRIRAIEGLNEYKLTNKIRTNKEIASFVQKLFYLNYKDRNTDNILNYPSISIVYANNTLEAEHFIAAYRNRGYVFINFTKSLYNKSPFDGFEEDFDTHHVIGQEFDLVAMLIDNTFYYDENDMLQSNVHPNPDYLYNQLLFQGLTRVREKLVIIVLDNMNFFEKLIKCLSK